jgi:hypothetical protein
MKSPYKCFTITHLTPKRRYFRDDKARRFTPGRVSKACVFKDLWTHALPPDFFSFAGVVARAAQCHQVRFFQPQVRAPPDGFAMVNFFGQRQDAALLAVETESICQAGTAALLACALRIIAARLAAYLQEGSTQAPPVDIIAALVSRATPAVRFPLMYSASTCQDTRAAPRLNTGLHHWAISSSPVRLIGRGSHSKRILDRKQSSHRASRLSRVCRPFFLIDTT